MRGAIIIAGASLALALAACEPPPGEGRAIGAAEVDPPKRSSLPAPVQATVKRLLELADGGDYRAMADFASETPDFRSNAAGMTHSEYWYLKMRTGDVPMAQMKKILGYPHIVKPSSQGPIYIWPALATIDPDEITPAQAREIDGLLGPGQAEAIRKGAIWPGYVLGIRADGRWLYFVSGSG